FVAEWPVRLLVKAAPQAAPLARARRRALAFGPAAAAAPAGQCRDRWLSAGRAWFTRAGTRLPGPGATSFDDGPTRDRKRNNAVEPPGSEQGVGGQAHEDGHRQVRA